MAVSLIESMSDDWRPDAYRDTYTDRVNELIESKRSGKEFQPSTAAPEPTNVVDLLDVLRRSVDDARSGRRPKKDGAQKGSAEKASAKKATAKKATGKKSTAKATAKKAAAKKASSKAAAKKTAAKKAPAKKAPGKAAAKKTTAKKAS
jgi:DNA end-binding protein Ku